MSLASGLPWGEGMRLGPGVAHAQLSGGSGRATLVCAWAEKGADALGPDGQLLHSDAFPPPRVVDTLGAGDTFNASVIFSLSQGESLGRRHQAGAGPCPGGLADPAAGPSLQERACRRR